MPERREVDPITLEVIGHSLRAIAQELETNLTRTSFSPLIYEYQDYAVGIVSADGGLICQGTGGLPIFLADIGAPLASVLEAHPPETLVPGDAIVTNDPEASGQHLNNVTMYTPVFAPELVAFIAVRTHWSDVGGRVLGSCLVNDSTDVFQEGLTLPALKLAHEGVTDPHVLRLIERNCRLPEMVIGDLKAQLAACRLGEERFGDLMRRYGWETIHAVIEDSWQRSEEVARHRISRLPDGAHDVECFLDNDGIHLDEPIWFRMRVVVDGDRIVVDMSGIADEVAGPYNAGHLGGGVTAAKVAFKYALIPDLPANEGCFRPLEVVLPPGKVLSAGPTAPRARWNVPMSSVIDVIVRAFGEVAPGAGAAGHHAAQNSLQFVGRGDDGRVWQHHDTAHGGWGALPDADGTGPFKTMAHGDCRDIPAEIVEALYPLRLEEVTLRTDSAGAGRHRGGLGMRRTYTTLAESRFTAALERTGCPPWGVDGGLPGSPGSIRIELPGGETIRDTKPTGLALPVGTRVTIKTAGGGGYGAPAERAREAVLADLRAGYVSPEWARAHHGIDNEQLAEK